MLFALTAIYVDDMRLVTKETGTEMPIWIFPFMYSQFHTKLIFTLPVVLLFCSAPFIDRNQTFVFIRTGRVKWLFGQVLYIVIASAVYYLFILVVSILLTVFSGGFSLDWGKTLPMLATSQNLGWGGALTVDASYMVIAFFTPLQAVWFTFLLSWLGAVFIGLMIFALNLISGTRYIGVLVSSFFVVLSSMVAKESGWDGLLRFSPMSWITLDKIDVGGLTKNPSFTYCVCVFAVLIVALAAVILIFGRKKSLDVKEED